MTEKKPFYTDDELIRRVWDIEDIKDLMGRRVYYVANEWRRQELSDLWVTKPENRRTASFGRNWGFYVGMEEISNYYVVKHDKDRQEILDALCAENHDIENKRENLGLGCLINHPISSSLVELAIDGKTAKGMWYGISHETTALPGGHAEARWMMEKIGVDFIKEDDDWKIWHMVIATDLTCEAGDDYGKQPVYPEPGTDPVENEFGTPTIAMLIHNNTFNWWDNYPAQPEPYYTFTDDISYGPEGISGLQRLRREHYE